MSNNSLAFLFGSGISIPSGLGSVENITEEILSFCDKPEDELERTCKSMKYPYISSESFELILILRKYIEDNYKKTIN